MKLSKVTIEQAYVIAENWLSRARKLTSVWRDETRSEQDRLRAFGLCLIMNNRVAKVASVMGGHAMVNIERTTFKSGRAVVSDSKQAESVVLESGKEFKLNESK